MELNLVNFYNHCRYSSPYDVEESSNEFSYNHSPVNEFVWFPNTDNPWIVFNFYEEQKINRISMSVDFDTLDKINIHTSLDGLNWSYEYSIVDIDYTINRERTFYGKYVRIEYIGTNVSVYDLSIVSEFSFKIPENILTHYISSVFSEEDESIRKNQVDLYKQVFEMIQGDNSLDTIKYFKNEVNDVIFSAIDSGGLNFTQDLSSIIGYDYKTVLTITNSNSSTRTYGLNTFPNFTPVTGDLKIHFLIKIDNFTIDYYQELTI